MPAKLIRIDDYVPMGGWVKSIRKRRTGGLFAKSYITLTFYTGEDYVDYTTESHIPVDVERIYDVLDIQVNNWDDLNKEKK